MSQQHTSRRRASRHQMSRSFTLAMNGLSSTMSWDQKTLPGAGNPSRRGTCPSVRSEAGVGFIKAV